MGLIKKISKMHQSRQDEKELRQEERLILREMAQERLAKKRELEQKQKVFDTMLDMRLPCENIIRLENSNPFVKRYNYYLMDTIPLTILLLMQEKIQYIPCKFKQLTDIGAGNIYKGRYNPNLEDNGVHVYLNPLDRSKLTVSINGYRNGEIEQHFGERTELEKQYGKTISVKQLLLLWKKDNGIEETINIDRDYEMVKQLYDSEDILREDKEQINSKKR